MVYYREQYCFGTGLDRYHYSFFTNVINSKIRARRGFKIGSSFVSLRGAALGGTCSFHTAELTAFN